MNNSLSVQGHRDWWGDPAVDDVAAVASCSGKSCSPGETVVWGEQKKPAEAGVRVEPVEQVMDSSK